MGKWRSRRDDMSMKCIGCDTPIPNGSTCCPMCGAPALKVEPPSVPTASPQAALPVTEVHHHHHHTVNQDQPMLIEKTGKKWKKLQLWAILCCGLGVVSCVAGASSGNPGSPAFSTIFWLAGLELYIYSRMGAWWHHG